MLRDGRKRRRKLTTSQRTILRLGQRGDIISLEDGAAVTVETVDPFNHVLTVQCGEDIKAVEITQVSGCK